MTLPDAGLPARYGRLMGLQAQDPTVEPRQSTSAASEDEELALPVSDQHVTKSFTAPSQVSGDLKGSWLRAANASGIAACATSRPALAHAAPGARSIKGCLCTSTHSCQIHRWATWTAGRTSAPCAAPNNPCRSFKAAAEHAAGSSSVWHDQCCCHSAGPDRLHCNCLPGK